MRSDKMFRSFAAPATMAAAALLIFATQPNLHGQSSSNNPTASSAASATSNSTNNSSDMNNANQSPDGSAVTLAGQDMMDKAFIRRTISRSRLSVQIGQMALQKSTNDTVREIARLVIRDRGHLDDTFTSLAKTMNVTVSDLPGKDQADVIARLDKLSGPEFDSAYLKVIIGYQKELDDAFHREGSYAANNDLKNITSHIAPILHSHRERIEQLAQASVVASR